MNRERKTQTVFVQVVEKPRRKLLLKRGKEATEYFQYCEEVGCEVWEVLKRVEDALFEPAGYWLPEVLRTPGTSRYVQGVEVPLDFQGKKPEGYELLTLPKGTFMVFQGEPFEEEDFGAAIEALREHIASFDPTLHGFYYEEDTAPSFQLEPQGQRGYIEARPVSALKD